MSIITIVGAGMMGSAIGIPAAHNGHEVRLVGTPLDREIIDHARETGWHLTMKRRLPDSYRYYQFEEMGEALKGADLLVGGVSSFGVDWFCQNVLRVIDPELPVLTVTKGMMDDDNGGLHVYPELFERQSGNRGLKLNAVGGPCTSYELADLDDTEVAFCGKDPELLRWIKSLFETDYYHISISTDVVGIESAVALKNGYALGIALTVGVNQRNFGIDSELHYNSQAAVFGQAVREMAKLLELQGAGTLDNLAVGAGDLYVTVYGGRTRLVGILLGRGLNVDEAKAELNGVTLESLVVAVRVARAVRILAERGRVDPADFPLLMHVDAILTEKAPVDIPWEKFTFGNG